MKDIIRDLESQWREWFCNGWLIGFNDGHGVQWLYKQKKF